MIQKIDQSGEKKLRTESKPVKRITIAEAYCWPTRARLPPAFRSNDNHTIRCSRTINGG